MVRGTKGDSPTRRRNGGGARQNSAGEQGEKTEREREGERVPGNSARKQGEGKSDGNSAGEQ